MKTHTKTLLATLTACTACTAFVGTSQAEVITNVNASDATFIRDSQLGTNHQSSSTNVANDQGGNDRIAFYTFDFSAVTDSITAITLTLTENAGDNTNEYEVFGIADFLDMTTLTWTTAVSGGYVDDDDAVDRPIGTSLGTFNSTDGSGTYAVTLASSFFDGDADGKVTLAIADNNSDNDGIGWTDGAVLNVTSVPEPGSLALLAIGGLLIARRRRD